VFGVFVVCFSWLVFFFFFFFGFIVGSFIVQETYSIEKLREKYMVKIATVGKSFETQFAVTDPPI